MSRIRVGAALLALAALGACGPGGEQAARGSAAPSAGGPVTGTEAPAGPAGALLATLAVKGRAPMTGYDRDLFGQAWADVDRNGCDTRNDILRRDLTGTAIDTDTHGCVVLSGESESDPYTGEPVQFARGTSTLDIDHVVALADAWQKGAAGWDVRKRIAFSNDPLNLLAVDAGVNRAKGAGDAATWLPPNRAYWCPYVARQVAVKSRYEIWVTQAEHDSMARILGGCPDEPVPTSDAPVLAPEGLGVPPAEQPPVADPALDPQFSYCYEAKAAGHGPYVSGIDPEYDWYRDADSDGRVCE